MHSHKFRFIRVTYWTGMTLLLILWFILFLFAIPSLLVKWGMNKITDRYHRYVWRQMLRHRLEELRAHSA